MEIPLAYLEQYGGLPINYTEKPYYGLYALEHEGIEKKSTVKTQKIRTLIELRPNSVDFVWSYDNVLLLSLTVVEMKALRDHWDWFKKMGNQCKEPFRFVDSVEITDEVQIDCYMKSPEEYYIQLKKKTHINVMLKRVPTLNMSLYEIKQRTVDQLDTIKKV